TALVWASPAEQCEDTVVPKLKNNVHAVIGIALPFIGVHDTSACENILNAEDLTPAPCPLEANKEYIYSNAFFVHEWYPEVSLTVEWSLVNGDDIVICFKIPAVIYKKNETKKKLVASAKGLGTASSYYGSYDFESLQDRVVVEPCGKKKCKLPKGQNITVTLKFKTNAVMKTLTNDVSAIIIAGVPLPFLGVHDTSACANIINAEDRTPAPCPLEAGKEYIYSNAVFVEDWYPETDLRVRWGLNDGHTKVICFEIPSAIVKKKPKKTA
ncbi:Niemann-pick type C-2b, partial [Operophtera brumata]